MYIYIAHVEPVRPKADIFKILQKQILKYDGVYESKSIQVDHGILISLLGRMTCI